MRFYVVIYMSEGRRHVDGPYAHHHEALEAHRQVRLKYPAWIEAWNSRAAPQERQSS